MLERDGKLVPEECYTTQGRDFKYTLIKLSRTHRPRLSAVEKFLKVAHDKYNIIKNEIFGYDSVASNTKDGSKIEEHPGFMLMTEHMNNGNEMFECWMDGGDIKTYKNGLLWKYRVDVDPAEFPKGVLVQKAKENTQKIELLSKENAELDGLVQTFQQENMRLEEENKQLNSRVQHLEGRVKRQYEIICGLDPDNSHLPKRMTT
jgi:hypothetical protein